MIIDHSLPYQEDKLKEEQIGSYVFEVYDKMARCILSNLELDIFNKSLNSKSLKTFSKYRKNNEGEVCFGMCLIPRKLGGIKLED